MPIEGSWAGRAFTSDTPVKRPEADGSTRLFLPMLDGSDRVGVLSFVLDAVDDDDRRLARRLANAAGKRLDEAQPFVDARLADGTRLHAVLWPVSASGSCLSLRVLRPTEHDLDALSAAELARLVELLTAPARAVVDTGEIPSTTPMGPTLPD